MAASFMSSRNAVHLSPATIGIDAGFLTLYNQSHSGLFVELHKDVTDLLCATDGSVVAVLMVGAALFQ
jgi:hypothetical protein